MQTHIAYGELVEDTIDLCIKQPLFILKGYYSVLSSSLLHGYLSKVRRDSSNILSLQYNLGKKLLLALNNIEMLIVPKRWKMIIYPLYITILFRYWLENHS